MQHASKFKNILIKERSLEMEEHVKLTTDSSFLLLKFGFNRDMRCLLISGYIESVNREEETQKKHGVISMHQFLEKLKGLCLALSFLSLSFIHFSVFLPVCKLLEIWLGHFLFPVPWVLSGMQQVFRFGVHKRINLRNLKDFLIVFLTEFGEFISF